MAEKGLIITGAWARFSIEGVKVGSATDVNLGEEIQYEEANVLDNIEDTKTGKLLATVEQVKIASHNYAINARGIVGQDVTFNSSRSSYFNLSFAAEPTML